MPLHKTYSYDGSPTLLDFATDDSYIRCLMGCLGSGKSGASIMEIVNRARAMPPCSDGMIRNRTVVIRNTYQQLKDTTMRSFFSWFPKHECGVYNTTDKTYKMNNIQENLELEILFRALDDEDDISNVLSLEVTNAWLNEAREIKWAIVDAILGRIGRYPECDSMKTVDNPTGYYWNGIWLDTNPPDMDSDLYKFFEEPKVPYPDKYAKIFKQPPGISTYAENFSHLKENYYTKLMVGKSDDYINVYIYGNYGYTKDGKPVYPSYSDNLHTAKKEIKVIPYIPIIIGWDFGVSHSACVICQVTLAGKFNVLEEFIAEDMGIDAFIPIVKPVLVTKYWNNDKISIGDPAGMNRTNTDAKTVYDYLKKAGIQSKPARTNSIIARVEAVDKLLRRRNGDDPVFSLSPNCKVLRKAFNGGYKYAKVKGSGGNFKELPDKGFYSHISDCVQYAALHLDENITQERNRTGGRYNNITHIRTAAGAM